MLLVAALALVGAALNLAALAVRVHSAASCGEYSVTTGAEAQPIFGIWKSVHGHPVYEWPNRDNFNSSLYNFGFYWFYGAALRVAGVDEGGLFNGARWVTLLFWCGAAVLSWRLVVRACRIPPLGAASLAAAGLAVSTLLSSGMISWWAFTARPEAAGVFFLVLGMNFWLPGVEGPESRRAVLAAALCFVVSWCFKQTFVLAAGSLGLYSLFRHRSWWEPGLLAAGFIIPTSLILLLGGEVYRYNVLVAPGLNSFSSKLLREHGLQWLMGGSEQLLGIVLFRLAWSRRGDLAHFPRSLSPVMVMVPLVGLVSWGLSGRWGGSRNYLFEAHLMAGLLAAGAVAGLLSSGGEGVGRMTRILMVAVLVPTALRPAAQLIVPGVAGRLELHAADRLPLLRREAATLDRVPKPFLEIDYTGMNLPWRSSGGDPDIVMPDHCYLGPALAKGHMPADYLDRLLESGRFAAVLLPKGHAIRERLGEFGYRQDEILGADFSTHEVWVRTGPGEAPVKAP